jgi:hypothetical protein
VIVFIGSRQRIQVSNVCGNDRDFRVVGCSKEAFDSGNRLWESIQKGECFPEYANSSLKESPTAIETTIGFVLSEDPRSIRASSIILEQGIQLEGTYT